jgi:hypothetical protein
MVLDKAWAAGLGTMITTIKPLTRRGKVII